MKIENSYIQLSSQRIAFQKHVVKESIRMRIGNQQPDFEGQGSSAKSTHNATAAVVTLSEEAQASLPIKKAAPADAEIPPEHYVKMLVIKVLLEKLTGKKIKLSSPKELLPDEENIELSNSVQAARSKAEPSLGFSIEYDYYESHYESEHTTFSAEGVMKTTDGKEITFAVDVSLSREFMREQNLSIRIGDAARKIDPLVINFNGTAAQLTDTKFSFDIDSDGRVEQISFVAPNSGFLALDHNDDGRINNGNELFGPTAGNGFAELAVYDADHNNWIDENDSIYSRLRIWSKDAQGSDTLVALGQKGIGAIYLGHLNTTFDLKDKQNRLQGSLKSFGIYVNENGSVGTIQQVDLVV